MKRRYSRILSLAFLYDRQHTYQHRRDAISRKSRIGEAGELLGVSSQTVRRYCEAGKISFTLTPGGQRVFDEAELKRQFGIDDDPVPVQPRETVFYVRGGEDVKGRRKSKLL